MLIKIMTLTNWFILIYFFVLNAGYIILLLASISEVIIRFKEFKIGEIEKLMRSPLMPGVTVVIAAYNEEKSILDAVESVRKSDFPDLSIIIVNPGSTDNMLDKLIKTYDLYQISPFIEHHLETEGNINGYYISKTYKNITVIDTPHTDRSDTLNIGINSCHTPLFVSVDADTLVEPDAISRILFYMLSRPYMIAAGGAVLVLNGSTYKNGEIIETNISLNSIYAFQTCEYLRSFYFGRVGWNSFSGALCYSGTFTLLNTEAVVNIGGYKLGNLAQDFEVITHLHETFRKNNRIYRIGYTPAAAVWTDAPGTVKDYWHQRYNWQYNTLKSLMPYKNMLFNPKYGITGFFTYPFYLFGEALSAVVEFTAYILFFLSWWLGILNVYWVALFIILCWGLSILLTMATFLLDIVTFNRYRNLRNIVLVLFFSIIEIFGFRQMNVLCRSYATFAYFAHNLTAWFRNKSSLAAK